MYSNKILIHDTQSALDLMMTVRHKTDCTNIVMNKEAIIDDFFILSTRLAGEILQKFIHYGVKVAIYGDFSKYTSKPLKDFIYEKAFHINNMECLFLHTKNFKWNPV